MAASFKVAIAVFLLVLCTPSAFGGSFAASDSPAIDPSAAPSCTWHKVNEELLCDGKVYTYEAQDSAFSGRWFLDMGVVGILVIFAGTCGTFHGSIKTRPIERDLSFG